MARLWRPSIPLDVQYRVALRQIGTLWIEEAVRGARASRKLRHWVDSAKQRLMELYHCDALHLDHDPPLAARQRKGTGKNTVYTPAANDPEHLIYRPKAEHQIKTNVRGDHGQYPDRVLIKRERKRNKPAAKYSRKYSWPKRKLRSASRWPKKK
jgi:hypothetical protein